MSESNEPKYVIDMPLGGRVAYEAVVGLGAPRTTTPHERVWPAIPLDYCPPPPEIENAVKEVGCILEVLQRTLTPIPLPEDDLQLMSDYLLSLETRDDITSHVLMQTNARSEIGVVSRTLMKDDYEYNFKARATALDNHWSAIQISISKDSPTKKLIDHPTAPLKTELPVDKPSGWKLDLGAARTAEAQRQLELRNIEKARCFKYWTTVQPPRPIGWVPADGEAWKKVSRADLESGNLFFSPDFSPIWEDFMMASLDAAFWRDPDNTEEQEREYGERMTERARSTKLSLEMRSARKAAAEELGFKNMF